MAEAKIVDVSSLLAKPHLPIIEAQFKGLKRVAIPTSFIICALDATVLSPEDWERLSQDLHFLTRIGTPAVEHATARLDNYQPTNESQRELLEQAQRFVRYRGLYAGLFIHGKPGLGKSHIAVGVAKQLGLHKNGVAYLTPDSKSFDAKEFYEHPLSFARLLVLDDLTGEERNPFITTFRKAVLFTYHQGGKLVVTSNLSFEETIDNTFPSYRSKEEKEKFIDRANALFRTCLVTGESQRPTNRW